MARGSPSHPPGNLPGLDLGLAELDGVGEELGNQRVSGEFGQATCVIVSKPSS
jgi:hypothetical protein